MANVKLICGDWRQVMSRLSPQSVDLLLTDPPYGCTALNWDQAIDWRQFFQAAHRVCKPNAVMVFFGTYRSSQKLIAAWPEGFRYDLVWHKKTAMGFLHSNRRPLRNHEFILVFTEKLFSSTYNPVMHTGRSYKTSRRGLQKKCSIYNYHAPLGTLNTGSRFPVSVMTYMHDYPKLFPAQKPVPLLGKLISMYSNPGDLILDPFAGSGSTLIAAAQSGRRVIGIEKDLSIFALAKRRLHDAGISVRVKK